MNAPLFTPLGRKGGATIPGWASALPYSRPLGAKGGATIPGWASALPYSRPLGAKVGATSPGWASALPYSRPLGAKGDAKIPGWASALPYSRPLGAQEGATIPGGASALPYRGIHSAPSLDRSVSGYQLAHRDRPPRCWGGAASRRRGSSQEHQSWFSWVEEGGPLLRGPLPLPRKNRARKPKTAKTGLH